MLTPPILRRILRLPAKVRFFLSQVVDSILLKLLPFNGRSRKTPVVFYLTENYPFGPVRRSGFAIGGAVKMLYLAEKFPHSIRSNILYTVSSVGYARKPEIITNAKKKGIKIVVNQNGVAYPAWHGLGWEDTNLGLSSVLSQADYIVYQSQFCQLGAQEFLSPPSVPSEVIYNPVDTDFFVGGKIKRPKKLTLILGGNQFQKYRVTLALQTLQYLRKYEADVNLVITGKLWGDGAVVDDQLRSLGLRDHVKFVGEYTQEQAPYILGQAHILLHTQYGDASPTLVLEAMSLGLPVVYLNNGGTPELVADAGLGVNVQHSWNTINLPDPSEMGLAVLSVFSNYNRFSEIARDRAVSQFSLVKFVEKHSLLFQNILES